MMICLIESNKFIRKVLLFKKKVVNLPRKIS